MVKLVSIKVTIFTASIISTDACHAMRWSKLRFDCNSTAALRP